jgi:hypothetical protein
VDAAEIKLLNLMIFSCIKLPGTPLFASSVSTCVTFFFKSQASKSNYFTVTDNHFQLITLLLLSQELNQKHLRCKTNHYIHGSINEFGLIRYKKKELI